MKEIKLSQGFVTQVDDEDYDYLNQWKWYAKNGGVTYYAARKLHYKPYMLMHRVILNTPPNLQVDHIDHNGLNNQKSNLRNCTQSQNNMNSRTFKKKASKYRGVSCPKIGNRYYIYSHITINNKTIHLGSFKTEIEAAIAYDKKAKELFGEFANLNFK